MPVEFLVLHPEEHALRMHIQRQTLEYAQKYITTDHVWYTETGVAELTDTKIFSAALNEISQHAPTDVSFPTDPLDKFFGTNDLEPHDEQFVLSLEERDGARKIIAENLTKCRRKGVASRSTVVMKTEDPNVLETPRRPLSPILTARARRQTPKLLHRSKAQILGMLPTEISEGVDKARIHPVPVEDIVDEHIQQEPFLWVAPTWLRFETQLIFWNSNVQYTMSKAEADEFRNFVTRVPAGKTRRPPSGFVDFLRSESPPPPAYFPPRMSPPLFARARTTSMATGRAELALNNLAETVDIAGIRRVEVDEGFGLDEIAQENMKMLCGDFDSQDILPPSSPPPLSLHHTDFSSSDAAQASSPPRTPRIHPSERAFLVSSSPGVREIKLAKLDEILFPSDQQRGRRIQPNGPSKFSDLVAGLHHPIPVRLETGVLPPIATILVPASPSISNNSIAGQLDDEEEIDELADDNSALPSRRTSRAVSRRTSGKTISTEVDELADDDTLVATVVGRLTRGVGVDPFEYVMKEKLDEKETLMLDVPELLPPNVSGTPGQPAPTSLSDFVGSSKGQQGEADMVGLRKVGGIKPLQIELGWRVTVPGQHVTHEQAAGVQNPTDPETKSLVKQFRAGLNEVRGLAFDREQPGERVEGVGKGRAWGEAMIMTREEREKVYGRRSSNEGRHTNPSSEEPELESQSDEYNNLPRPHAEPGTQASFVPLSFEAYNPQSQWDEPAQPDHTSELEPYSPTEEQAVYRQSWVENNGYYDQEIEMQGAEGDDPYWFQILSQTQPAVGDVQPVDEVIIVEPGYEDVGMEAEVERILEEDDSRLTMEVELAPVMEIPTYQGQDTEAIRTAFLQPEHSASSKLAAFMHIVAKAKPPVAVPPVAPVPPPVAPSSPRLAPGGPAAEDPTPGRSLYPIPEEIRTLITLTPDPCAQPEPFRILANMQIMHHRALVSALEHPSISLHLVERSSSCPATSPPITWPWQDISTPLHGASFALDPSSALVLVPLAELASPDAVPALSRLLQSVLTRFEWIGLVLEAYPRPKPQSRRADPESDPNHDRDSFTLNPFTPPAVKSFSALRRALVLLHNALGLVPVAGTGGVEVGIGRSVGETASIIRCAVDRAAENWRAREGREGEVWGVREWVEDGDESMEEQELANVPGMNVFAAITILVQTTVDELLGMTAEERARLFGPSATENKVAALNEVIAQGQARVEMIGQLGGAEE
ncbi:hypothetical protein FRC10_010881 [Ceratobasidium sp. 414]|nr:hypothetical protein FRC10_010881 [Ceratobasidium sp. 414]